jgi:hypothetical protein
MVKIENLEEMTIENLEGILGLTIKKDKNNKLLVFLSQLSAYTEDSQLNISFNAPSSTGKSYIPLEIANLFPIEDVIKLAYCSPTSFFHEVGEYSKEKGGYIVDLERKIIIFLDQPHSQLLGHLRPLLSHDQKEVLLKITDKQEKHGLRTKNIFMKGFPAVIFCTANFKVDEQEATRFLLLSPEMSQEKIREAIYEKTKKESNKKAYLCEIESNAGRSALKKRIKAIKEAHITEIKINSAEKKEIEKLFFERHIELQPRHARDISRLISIIKTLALLNLWHRKIEDSIIVVTQKDVEEGFRIWDEIYLSQELNLPVCVYNFFQEIIVPAYKEKQQGLTKQEILKKHFQVYGRPLADWQLRQDYLPMLENAGLIIQETDPTDRRKTLVIPNEPPHQSTHYISDGRNSELESGLIDPSKLQDTEIIEKNDLGSPTLIKATIYGRKDSFIIGECLKCNQTGAWVLKGNNICYECHKEIEATDKKTEEEQ